jgi:hypothetical protein
VNQTVFGDLRQRALAVYRVKTRASVYIVGVHEARGRRFVIVRGEPGGDREHVVVRDSDPRIGEHSLFELTVDKWPGHTLEVATMTSSQIVSVETERDQVAIHAVSVDGANDRSPWARPDPNAPAAPVAGSQASGGMPIGGVPFKSPRPAGMPDNPAIVPGRARGTNPAADAAMAPHQAAKQVVVGGTVASAPQEPELPYPHRHVKYAESCAQLLRSLNRRDRIFEDLAHNKPLRDTLRKSLDDCVDLLEQIRRRDRR